LECIETGVWCQTQARYRIMGTGMTADGMEGVLTVPETSLGILSVACTRIVEEVKSSPRPFCPCLQSRNYAKLLSWTR
jgi:hypothetical protein